MSPTLREAPDVVDLEEAAQEVAEEPEAVPEEVPQENDVGEDELVIVLSGDEFKELND